MVQLMFIFYGLPMVGYHAAGHFVDPELFALFRRHYRHEHQQLRLRR